MKTPSQRSVTRYKRAKHKLGASSDTPGALLDSIKSSSNEPMASRKAAPTMEIAKLKTKKKVFSPVAKNVMEKTKAKHATAKKTAGADVGLKTKKKLAPIEKAEIKMKAVDKKDTKKKMPIAKAVKAAAKGKPVVKAIKGSIFKKGKK